jgi:hypothetical protein
MQIIIGSLLLLPGLCGTLTFGMSFLVRIHSASAMSPPLMNTFVAVPAIQLGCLGLWLLSRTSETIWLRKFTRVCGWFAAFSTLVFVIRVTQFLLQPNSYVRLHLLSATVSYLVMAILPFLLGGLPALLLKPYPEIRERSVGDKEHP